MGVLIFYWALYTYAKLSELSIVKNHCQVEHLIEELLADLKSRTFDRIPATHIYSAGEQVTASRFLAPNLGHLRLESGSESSSDENFRPFPIPRKPFVSPGVRINMLASPESEGKF